jgi:hypothetical protein
MHNLIVNTQTSYDQIAAEYAERFKDKMDDKPFDRDCLDRLAHEVGGLGPICDLGCGPGQIALPASARRRHIRRGPLAAHGRRSTTAGAGLPLFIALSIFRVKGLCMFSAK